MADTQLSGKRRQILECIERQVRERGYPPSVREIGEAVGLTSSSTVHTHLQILQRQGYLRRDPTKPRAIEVSFEPSSGAAIGVRPVAHVPLVGDVAAGVGVLAEENVEEVLPVPEDLTGPGELFMLRVRGDSMTERGDPRRRPRRRPPPARGRSRRCRRRRDPRRRGDGEDVPAASRPRGARPGEPRTSQRSSWRLTRSRSTARS